MLDTSIELKAESIDAVRLRADLALADKYLNHSSAVVPSLALAGALSLFGGPFLGAVGVLAGIAYCVSNDIAYQRKSKEVRTTTNFAPIAHALKKHEDDLEVARQIWKYKGDLKRVAWETRYNGVIDVEYEETVTHSLPPAKSASVPVEVVNEYPSTGELIPRKKIALDPDAPHFLLMAGTREGKSNALRCLLESYERVNYVTTKITDTVPTSWNGYLINGNTEAKGLQLKSLVDDWSAKVAAHAANPNLPVEWFVFDESINLKNYAKSSGIKNLVEDLKGLQLELATQGAAIGCYCVLIGQTKNAGPFGIDLDILQQNFRLVLPLKAKRKAGMTVIEKMGGLKLTDNQQNAIVNNPNQYFQLWLGDNEDLYYDVLPEFNGQLKPLELYPVNSCDSSETTIPVKAQTIPLKPQVATAPVVAPKSASKVSEFLAKYDNDQTKQLANNRNQNAVKAMAYCKLFKELRDAQDNTLRISRLASSSGLVSTLFAGGVITKRAKEDWYSHLVTLEEKGYITINEEEGTISL